MIDCQPPAMSYRRAEVLLLPFKRRYEKIEIMPEVSCCPFALKLEFLPACPLGHSQSVEKEGRKEHRPSVRLQWWGLQAVCWASPTEDASAL